MQILLLTLHFLLFPFRWCEGLQRTQQQQQFWPEPELSWPVCKHHRAHTARDNSRDELAEEHSFRPISQPAWGYVLLFAFTTICSHSSLSIQILNVCFLKSRFFGGELPLWWWEGRKNSVQSVAWWRNLSAGVLSLLSGNKTLAVVSCWNNDRFWWGLIKASGFLWNLWLDKVWELDYNRTHC